MKKIVILFLTVVFLLGCSDEFLERLPKGYYHEKNYKGDEIPLEILAQGKLAEAYGTLRGWAFQWVGLAMSNYTTPDVEKGSTPSDGGTIAEFKTLSYGTGSAQIKDYYTNAYKSIILSNEALAFINTMSDTVPNKQTLTAEALFLRSVMYYRLAQAFGGVPYINRVLSTDESIPPRSTREEIWQYCETDLLWAIDHLPTRVQLNSSGNQGRATQNAARALLAKVYLYQKKWSDVMTQTNAIIVSGDNDLSTPYADMFTELNEYGPESVFEVFCEKKPDLKISLESQFSQIQGVRGVPNLGWGFNAPSQVLMDAYEPGDPRKDASIIRDGEDLEGRVVKADAAGYKFFNKKAYVRVSERGVFGRSAFDQGYWMNIRIIRYADVLLMHAEAACELNNTGEALDKLEIVRNRARGGNASVLPKVTTTDQNELRQKIHHERRIEFAMEWERFYDLVRWNEAKDVIPNFVVGKHELFPIPQEEIDKSGGILTQNPGY